MVKKKKGVNKKNSKNSFNRNLVLGVVVVIALLVFGIKIGGYEITGNVIGDPNCNDNGVCDPGEDMASCPSDCFIFSICNDNGVCDPGEDSTNCPSDCTISGSCIGDGDCTDPSLPYCEDGNCVACYNDLGGTSIGCDDPFFPACDPTTNTCVQCSEDAHCAVVALHPVCNVADGNCVQCLDDGDCTDPNYPGCTDYGSCLECVVDAHCTGNSKGEVCDVMNNVCIECESNFDCPSDSPVCDVSFNYCVDCLTDADCTDPGLSYCVIGQFNNYCEECVDSTHCSGTTPICNAGNQCVRCITNQDCIDKGYSSCGADGSCVMDDVTVDVVEVEDTVEDGFFDGFFSIFTNEDVNEENSGSEGDSLFGELFEETFSFFDSFFGFFASFVTVGDTEGGDLDCGGLCGIDEICNAGICESTGGCLINEDCPEGEECNLGVCVPDPNACIGGCNDPDLPYCEMGTCVACLDESNTAGCGNGDYPVCDVSTNTCVACNDGNDCGGLLCDTSVILHRCVECLLDTDCDSGQCNPDGTCEPIGSGGACTTFGEDCPTDREVCDGTFCVLIQCADNTGFCQFDQDCQCEGRPSDATCVGGGQFNAGTCSWANV